jgi:hypothetical protein
MRNLVIGVTDPAMLARRRLNSRPAIIVKGFDGAELFCDAAPAMPTERKRL